MPAGERDFGQIYGSIQALPSGLLVDRLRIQNDPFTDVASSVRPNSVSVEDFHFGDGGKGKITQEMVVLLLDRLEKNPRVKEKKVYSPRANGSDNAGHEIRANSQEIAMHQLPVAVTIEGGVGIMSKGMLVHPLNLLTEIDYVSDKLGGRLWGELWIDQNATVVTDLHRAFEAFTNNFLGTGKGATSSGIAQGYSTVYEKRALTVRDFVGKDWEEKFRKVYRYYSALIGGEDVMAKKSVKAFTKEGGRKDKLVGTEKEYIDELREARTKIAPFVRDVNVELSEIWEDPAKPVVIEIGQGDILDPWHGIYPDITASRTIGRVGIPDATEGIIAYDQIAVPMGVIKIPYMSSVGSRVLPYRLPKGEEDMYVTENAEWGKSTGRRRGAYPDDAVLFQYAQGVARRKFVVYTHTDSTHADTPVKVVTRYVKKENGQKVYYRPYQWYLDQVEGVVEEFPSWDGEKAGKAKLPEELPYETLVYLSAMSETVGVQTLAASNGPNQGDIVYMFRQ